MKRYRETYKVFHVKRGFVIYYLLLARGRLVVPSILADELLSFLGVFLGPLEPAGYFSLLPAIGTGK